MEDIEKEIAGEEANEEIIKEEGHDDIEIVHDEELEEKEKEDDTIKYSKMGSNNDKKRNIIIIILVVIAIILIGTILVLALTKKDDNNDKKEDNSSETKEVVKEEETGKKVSYVSCDDNTSLLNVRNSSTGDIIDGLSCFKEIEILEEVEGTDACDKWYRVSYDKHGGSYTGYLCGKYVKDSSVDSNELKKIKSVIDKANKYYEDNQIMVYCGETNGTKTISIDTDGHTFEGQYLKSEFKSIDELKKYILTFLDESLIKVKLELSDNNNPKMYDNYYEIDGNLYCRNYSGKGWMTYYTGNYDIEIDSETENKVNLKIAYEYLDEDKLDEEGKCSLNNISSCSNSYFKYVIGNITLSKDNGNYIITSMNFHE